MPTFYPIPFGRVEEVRVDRRPQRPRVRPGDRRAR